MYYDLRLYGYIINEYKIDSRLETVEHLEERMAFHKKDYSWYISLLNIHQLNLISNSKRCIFESFKTQIVPIEIQRWLGT